MLQDKFDDALLNFQKVLMREPQNALARVNVGYICLKKRIFGEAIEHLSRAIRLDNDKKATLYAHFYLGLVYLERDMFEDAQTFFQKTIALGPNLIEAYFELGRAYWFNGQRDEATRDVEGGIRGEQVQSVGQALRRGTRDGGSRGRALGGSVGSRLAAVAGARLLRRRRAWLSRLGQLRAQDAPERLDRGRFTAVFYPERARARDVAARRRGRERHLSRACRVRTQRVLLAIAPDRRRFREWVGPGAPEWGAAITFPESQRIVMQGRSAGADAGDPREVLAPRARAPRAARVARRSAAAVVRRRLRELCGARVEPRGRAGGESRAGAARAHPTFDELDRQFAGGADDGAERVRARLSRGRRAGVARHGARTCRRFFDDVAKTKARWTRAMRTDVRASRSAGSRSAGGSDTRRRYGALALFSDVTLGRADTDRAACSRSMWRGGSATGGGWRRWWRRTRRPSERRARARSRRCCVGTTEPDFRGDEPPAAARHLNRSVMCALIVT